MEKQKSEVRFVYRRSSLLAKIIVLCAILLCLAALFVLWIKTDKLNKQNAQESTKATQTVQTNHSIEQDIQNVHTEKGMDKIAQEELGLHQEGSIIFETSQ